MHAPFPKWRDAKPRGANRGTEIIVEKSSVVTVHAPSLMAGAKPREDN